MEVWFLKCKGQGHDKDHFLVYQNYLVVGGLVPLKLENNGGSSMRVVPWCTIFQITGKYMMDNFHLLQKFVQTPQKLFCNFFKYVGHDECICRSYELMMDKTPTDRVQMEARPQDQGATVECGGFQG